MNKKIKTKLLAVSFAVSAGIFVTENAVASDRDGNYYEVITNENPEEHTQVKLVMVALPAAFAAGEPGVATDEKTKKISKLAHVITEVFRFSLDNFMNFLSCYEKGAPRIKNITRLLADVCLEFDRNYQMYRDLENKLQELVAQWIDYTSSDSSTELPSKLQLLQAVIDGRNREETRQVSAAGSNQFSLTETAAQRLLALLRQGQRDQQHSDKNMFDTVFGRNKKE